MTTPPALRPRNPSFGSGPTAKRPGWSAAGLAGAAVGRSHRAPDAMARLVEVIERSRALLGIPEEFRVGILGGSDTAAFEAAMWCLLGPRKVDVLAFDVFGEHWLVDARDQLRLPGLRALTAPPGALPDLASVDPARDLVFCWNGTTSGTCIPNGEWIAAERGGLTLCDATSAAFMVPLPWDRLDVVTWSWQKALGGEAQHGMIALSPRAIERLETHRPAWPVPKLYRLANGGRVLEGVFRGETINTPSLLAVEDALDVLRWAEAIGGREALFGRVRANAAALDRWLATSSWARHFVPDPAIRSPVSVMLRLATDSPAVEEEARWTPVRALAGRLAKEGVAFDITAHRASVPGLRLWCGPTVETADLEALCPWLDWAHSEVAEG